MQNVSNSSNLSAFYKGGIVKDLEKTLKSLVLKYGGAYWPLQETSGSDAEVFNTGITDSIAASTEGVFPDVRLEFDGSSTSADIPDAIEIQNIFDGGGWVSSWVYTRSDGGNNAGRIAQKYDGTAGGWGIYTSSESNETVKLNFFARWNNTTYVWVSTDRIIELNKPALVALYYDSSSVTNNPTFYVYQNNTLNTYTVGSGINAAQTPTGAYDNDSGTNVYIGTNQTSAHTFDGIIWDIRLGSGSLSAGDLTNLQNNAEVGSEVGWWKFDEKQGRTVTDSVNSNDGTINQGTLWRWYNGSSIIPYVACGRITGATLGQPGVLGNDFAYLFDGTNDYIDCYSSALNIFFSPDAGTLHILAKVANSGVWSDGVNRVLYRLFADSDNYVSIQRTTNNDELKFFYNAGGTSTTVTASGITTTGYISLAMTWDTTADEMKAYVNGIQVGSTQTGLGTWVGDLGATTCVVGAANTTPSNVWDGFLQGAAIFRTVLTSEILTISQKAGLA